MFEEVTERLQHVKNIEELRDLIRQGDKYEEELRRDLEQSFGNKMKCIKKIVNWKYSRQRALRNAANQNDTGDYGEAGHSENHGKRVEGQEEERVIWIDLESVFKRRLSTGMVANMSHIDPTEFLTDAFQLIGEHISRMIGKYRMIKVNTELNAAYTNVNVKSDVKSFATRNYALGLLSDIDEWYHTHVVPPILKKMEEFEERDSGWSLIEIHYICINVNVYDPLHAGCEIETPLFVAAKKAVINIKTKDNDCFAWAIVAALYPVKNNKNSVKSYPHYKEVLNVRSITFPTQLHEIRRFEEDNGISVNVYIYEERSTTGKKMIAPLLITANFIKDRHVNILYMKNTEYAHYMCITNLSRLISSKLTSAHREKHFCHRCLHYLPSVEKLEKHEVDCSNINTARIILPNKEEGKQWITFNNAINKEPVPVVVYADLECLLIPHAVDVTTPTDEQEVRQKKKTQINQKHVCFNIGYYVHNTIDSSRSKYVSYRGPGCDIWCAKQLHVLAKQVSSQLEKKKPMITLTAEEEIAHCTAVNCHICGKPFLTDEKRVYDHCHISGKSRGPAHTSCNLNYKLRRVIPIIFHNLSGYDAHFIINAVANEGEGNVDVLPINKERYISFTKHDAKYKMQLRFIDSFKFLASSLDKLSSYLGKDELNIFRTQFHRLETKQMESLMRKGVFPYDYTDSWEKLEETELPARKLFYNTLTDSEISEEDYKFAQDIWSMFGIRNLGEYSDLYLKTDVLLLADVFENFRQRCMQSYNLDPAHYYTLPSFTWDAMLKYTGIKLDLLTDLDMYLMIEKGIRGGLCQCSHRYARANNMYMQEKYDSTKPSSYLMYYDVNNLYGWAMSQHLPIGDFRWVDDMKNIEVMSIADDSPVGYIFEVDLAYPKEFHDLHAELPFCPSRKMTESKQCKLIADVKDKERYVIHYRTLKQCLSHGLVLTRIHRCISFNQSPWLHRYIKLNTDLRTKARNDFDKNLFKLMNNAVFGKTMENMRKRVDVKLVKKWDGRYGVSARIAAPNFHSRAIFSENLVAIQLKKLLIELNKPMYVGMSILDISKTRLYDFHYNYMKQEYEDKCKLMYTDTDSLIYQVECEDIYKNMRRNLEWFDTSDYDEHNIYGMPRMNKKIPGIMKDENNGRIMLQFVGLRAKMYAMETTEPNNNNNNTINCEKKSKGVKKHVVARCITFHDYVDCLQNNSVNVQEQNLIRSSLHNVYSVKQSKVTLSPYDDKRYICADSCATLPWGHYKIN